ncbi:ankyrin repeat domain-containing protein [Legionella rowbothamii]|uniref:ankyrin repeat domain-containing protein n=1 Tax=Legionella rowbothamii TaxID=96229 RepID=UPI0010546C73|nr:ankyrin repeat domain-containing protein [Legionella rowbothamii]
MSNVKYCGSVKELLELINENNPENSWIKLAPVTFKNLSPEERLAIGQTLTCNTTLRRLDLFGIEIQDAFLINIHNALEKNSTLVDLAFNQEGHNLKILDALREKISKNRFLVLEEVFVPQLIELVEQQVGDEELFENAKKEIISGNAHNLYTLVSTYPQLLNKIDIFGEGLLYTAGDHYQIDCFKILLDFCKRDNRYQSRIDEILFWAIRQDDFVLTSLLLNRGGANVNANLNGYTPLHRVNSLDIAKLLIDHGANAFLTIDSEDIELRPRNGNTVLHSVLYNRRVPLELLEYLLGLGLSVNAQNSVGYTALHLLCSERIGTKNHLKQKIALLIKWGANPLIEDNEGRIPLHWAIWLNQNVQIWQSVTRDYVRTRDRTNLIKQGVRSHSFFGAPLKIMEHIALMAASTESLEYDACETIVKNQLWK